MENKINIIIPFYNCKDFLEGCLNSVLSQKYSNYKIIAIDDASTDGSGNIVPKDNDKIIYLRNEKNLTALPNIHRAVMEFCEPDSICILLDGDDKLLNRNVCSFIDKLYADTKCWVSWGQSLWSDGRRGFASAYTEEEFKNIRKAPFRVSHIRSFIAKLYHSIQKQDENFSCLKDKNGEFYRCTYDVAIMWPLLELAFYNKSKFNDVPLYLYNRDNPISDDKIRQKIQWDIHAEISNKPSFKKIQSL